MTEYEDERKAFELGMIHQRKDTSKITSVVIDNDGIKLYLGLDNGILEEFKVLYQSAVTSARLCAKRAISKKAIRGLRLIGGINILAVLIEDGNVFLCSMEQLELVLLPNTKGVVSMTCDPRYVSPCGFATASRLGASKSRIDVFEISKSDDVDSGVMPSAKIVFQFVVQDEIKDINWVGNDIIICTKSLYCAINNKRVKKLLSSSTQPLCAPLPLSGLITLLWEEHMAVVCDLNGAAARPPLLLDSRPLVLTQGGMCIVAICKSGDIVIYDQKSSRQVQKIFFPLTDTFYTGDSQDAHVFHCDTPSGSCVVLACTRRVWLLRPVAPQSQTMQLLKSQNYSAAIELIEGCFNEGAAWTDTAFAQTAMLLFHENYWREAISCLYKCSPAVFQPLQLFPLFPQFTEKWKDQAMNKEYWGLHKGLYDLRKMLLLVSHKSNFKSLDCLENDQNSENFQMVDLNSQSQNETEIEEMIASYLLQVREKNDIVCIEGIDSLIACLLSNCSSTKQLENFCTSNQQIIIEEVSGCLKKNGHHIALSFLYENKGLCSHSLDIYKNLVFGDIKESLSLTGALVEARGNIKSVAAYHTARLLNSLELQDGILIMRHLAWLKEKSPRRFVQVFQAKDLSKTDLEDILASCHMSLKLIYLYHIINKKGSDDEVVHTDYAITLVELIQTFINQNQINNLNQDEVDILESGRQLRRKLEPSLIEAPQSYEESLELDQLSLTELRFLLQSHIVVSTHYQGYNLLSYIENTTLYKEKVLLYCQLKRHAKALRVLAITLGDIFGAINYCKGHAGNEGFIDLLEILLKPGEGREPMFTEAIQVLNADSANLDPCRVLEALSEDMPLSLAYNTIARMLRERIHRKRQTKIIHELRRSQNIQTRAQWFEMQSTIFGRVYIDKDTTCVLCAESMRGRIFYRHPSGAIVCGSCQRKMNAANKKDKDDGIDA